MLRNMQFETNIKKESIADFEKIMLSSGQCRFFMPMGFMSCGENESVRFDCSGFAPLNRYRIERTDDALYLLEHVMLILGRSVEYLIAPWKIMLNTGTVFYNKETGEVKIAYIPVSGKEQNLRKNITNFIMQLRRDVKDNDIRYLDMTIKYINYNNYSIRDIINKIGMFKRQMYLSKKNS